MLSVIDIFCQKEIEWLRSQIGTVHQEPLLFHASVFENVAYGKPDATRDEVIEACKYRF